MQLHGQKGYPLGVVRGGHISEWFVLWQAQKELNSFPSQTLNSADVKEAERKLSDRHLSALARTYFLKKLKEINGWPNGQWSYLLRNAKIRSKLEKSARVRKHNRLGWVMQNHKEGTRFALPIFL